MMRLSQHIFLTASLSLLCCSYNLNAVAMLRPNLVPGYPTQILSFQPTLPSDPSKQGFCFSESIADQRPDAWRCSVAAEIFDPCFSISGNDNLVVCEANPATYNQGFTLQLTKPLPQRASLTTANITASNNAWLLKLSDNSICTPYTGTLPIVNQMAIRFYCSDSGGCTAEGICLQMSGLTDPISPGKVWTAKKIYYSVNPLLGAQLQKSKIVTISTVWK